jgi:hypothetical protein
VGATRGVVVVVFGSRPNARAEVKVARKGAILMNSNMLYEWHDRGNLTVR